MKVRYKKLIDSFAIIPHIDIIWITYIQFKLYYIRIVWLRWGVDIDIFCKRNHKKE